MAVVVRRERRADTRMCRVNYYYDRGGTCASRDHANLDDNRGDGRDKQVAH